MQSNRQSDMRCSCIRVCLLVGMVAVAPCTGVWAQKAPGDAPVAVEVAAVRAAPVRQEVRAVGSLSAEESVTLRPEVAGRIQTIHFREGERAGKGQPLVTLDPAEYLAQVAASEAAARLWELKFARARDLVEKKVLSRQEYDETQATLKEAEARLALERVRLEKMVIRAPFSGVIGLRQVSPGDYVEEGQALAALSAIDPIKVDFSVPERYTAQVKPGQRLTLAVETYRDRSFGGEVYAVDPQLDASARTVRLRGRLPNPAGELRPGMFARVSLVLGEEGEALWILEQALVPRGEEQYVFRVQDGRALLTRIEVGSRRAGEVEVVRGLARGDSVVTAGQLKLHDGAAVSVIGSTGAEPTVQR